MKRLFLDSDVILDVLLIRGDFYGPAANLIGLADKYEFITSPIVFVNVNYLLKKYSGPNTLSTLINFRQLVSIVDTNQSIVDMALKSNITDFEDAVQYYSALNAGADAIITRNIKDYKRSTIPVFTPEEFLKTL